MLIDDLQNLVKNMCICHFGSKQDEYFDFLEDGVSQFTLRHINDELAQEVEVNLCGDFLIDSFIDVIILVRRLTFSLFEVLVEFMGVFKEEMEYFAG